MPTFENWREGVSTSDEMDGDRPKRMQKHIVSWKVQGKREFQVERVVMLSDSTQFRKGRLV